ncbi:recombinase family protein [Salinispora arenicola]|nr:recombinase family protein [Salinispora arenicola]MCN0179975.1 recombinase family protein [Salinispora arenicola]
MTIDAERLGRNLAGLSFDAPNLRFAFYGRVSTEDNQDPESSRGWQLSLATTLIAPRGGVIVEEFFDIAHTRALPWQRRPEASRLLAALRNPQRGFTAVVIGEPHRAFYGNQFGLTLPLFHHYGVQLWVPEVGGPIDPNNEAHDLVMSVFGGMSKGERNRIKLRVRTAMATQTLLEGRYLGGRPPYGYMLTDLGAHPNPAKAAQGKRLHGLTPDPQTAPMVRRIFAMYLAGYGMFAIAEALTRDDIPCPSAYDRARNSHRDGLAWSKTAIRVILTNPRYIGRQVWNKQRTDEVLLDVNDVALGHVAVMRWNGRDQWVVSKDIVHEPLIDETDFAPRPGDAHQTSSHGHLTQADTPIPPPVHLQEPRHLRSVPAEDASPALPRCRLLPLPLPPGIRHRQQGRPPTQRDLARRRPGHPADTWLIGEFGPLQRRHTIAKLVNRLAPDAPTATPATPAGPTVAEYDAKLARYRAALEAGADPAVVAGWIAETQAERRHAKERQRTPTSAEATAKIRHFTQEEIITIVEELGDLVAALRDADPEHKLEVYRNLGLRLTYTPETQTVRADVDLAAHRWDSVCVRGGT